MIIHAKRQNRDQVYKVYVGMGCFLYYKVPVNATTRYDILVFFMHSDSWGQYGEETSDVPKLDRFIGDSEINEDLAERIDANNLVAAELVKLYNELFSIYALDVDVINLIVKYITLCGKIVKSENSMYMGVKDLNWTPVMDIPQLQADYFISKYNKPKKYWKSECYDKVLSIFINILLPFTNKYCYKIYDKL